MSNLPTASEANHALLSKAQAELITLRAENEKLRKALGLIQYSENEAVAKVAQEALKGTP